MSRALALAAVLSLAACGVKAAPRPPLPEGQAASEPPAAVAPCEQGCSEPSTPTSTSTSTTTKKP